MVCLLRLHYKSYTIAKYYNIVRMHQKACIIVYCLGCQLVKMWVLSCYINKNILTNQSKKKYKWTRFLLVVLFLKDIWFFIRYSERLNVMKKNLLSKHDNTLYLYLILSTIFLQYTEDESGGRIRITILSSILKRYHYTLGYKDFGVTILSRVIGAKYPTSFNIYGINGVISTCK